MCGDGGSIFKLGDQLDRNNDKLGDRNKNLDAMQIQKNCLPLSNRCLAAMTMYQSLHRIHFVKARYRICSNNTVETITLTTTKTLSQYDYITQLHAFCDWYSSCSVKPVICLKLCPTQVHLSYNDWNDGFIDHLWSISKSFLPE